MVLSLVPKTKGRLKDDLSAIAAEQSAGRRGPAVVSRAPEFLGGPPGAGASRRQKCYEVTRLVSLDLITPPMGDRACRSDHSWLSADISASGDLAFE